MSNQNCQEFLSTMEETFSNIKADIKFVNPDYVHDFEDKLRRANEHAEEIVNINRDLKIGIVGQVKAGKSSFLNALIFDGKDILPKAATPMTAALTKISFAQKSSAKVVFYSADDWKVIEENSRRYDEEFKRLEFDLKEHKKAQLQFETEYTLTEYDKQNIENKIPSQYRSCKELTEMASENILSKLGTEEEISVYNLQTDLENYVGANGTYTPIVKWLELSVNNDLLKGIEIIDTPGLGDPIMSRSEKTKEFLMACDLVFILSPTPQFMSKEDISLIVETLPTESINHAVIVGSKFDSAMLDDSGRGKQNLRQVLGRTMRKLNESAQRVITASRQAEKSFSHSAVLKRVEEEINRQISEEKSLYYTSSILYGAARKSLQKEDWNESEAHIITQMIGRFDGMKTDPEFLRELAGIDRLHDKEFTKIRKEKENIIAERSREFVKDQIFNFVKQINELQTEAEQMLRLTETSDISSLQKKLQVSQNALISMRRDIEKTFEICAIDTEKYIIDIANEIKTKAHDHSDISISEGQETETRYRKESRFILPDKKIPYEVTIVYHTANVSDVIRNLQKYITTSEKNIAEGLKFAVNIGEIRNRIKDVVLRAFQKADADFDENEILMPVESVLAKVTIPDFSVVDSEKYSKMITSEFPSAQVKDEDISKLELKQSQLLNQISQDITSKLEIKAKEISNQLKEHSLYFTDDVKKAIESRITRLQENLKNKESSIRRYREILEHFAACKDALRKFGENQK